MDSYSWSAILLSLKLAFIVSSLLIVISTPIAWWLAHSQSKFKAVMASVIALPLILPPTVLGFYLLIAMGPEGFIGQLTLWLGLGTLPFTFAGLVIASMLYSLPFVVQPLYLAFQSIGRRPIEVAMTLRSGPMDRFFYVLLPLAKSGYITAFILGFAHTVGEFGVVLMIGGNIPELTQVISIQIYDHVEALQYQQAHWLSAFMLIFSFVVLMSLYYFNQAANKDKKQQGGH